MQDVFGVDVMETESDALVHAWGELDVASVAEFDGCVNAAFAADTKRVVIDLRDVTFADGRAISSLERVSARAAVEHRDVVLRASRPVRRLLILTRSATRFCFD